MSTLVIVHCNFSPNNEDNLPFFVNIGVGRPNLVGYIKLKNETCHETNPKCKIIREIALKMEHKCQLS